MCAFMSRCCGSGLPTMLFTKILWVSVSIKLWGKYLLIVIMDSILVTSNFAPVSLNIFVKLLRYIAMKFQYSSSYTSFMFIPRERRTMLKGIRSNTHSQYLSSRMLLDPERRFFGSNLFSRDHMTIDAGITILWYIASLQIANCLLKRSWISYSQICILSL